MLRDTGLNESFKLFLLRSDHYGKFQDLNFEVYNKVRTNLEYILKTVYKNHIFLKKEAKILFQ